MMEVSKKNKYNLEGYTAFTWVPDPKEIGISPKFQYCDTLGSIRNLNMCCEKYVIYPECTKQGNIHFHGILKINDKVKWYKKVLPSFKYHGYVCIKNQDINDQWVDYISKDYNDSFKIYNIKVPIAMKKVERKINLPYMCNECTFTPELFMDYFMDDKKSLDNFTIDKDNIFNIPRNMEQ